MEFDPHAFLWWAPTRLAVLPVTLFDRSRQLFNGVVGLLVDGGAITEKRRIEQPPAPGDTAGYHVPVERSLVVGDGLYTVSSARVLASDLTTLADRAWVPFG